MRSTYFLRIFSTARLFISANHESLESISLVSTMAWRHSASTSGSLRKGDGGTSGVPPAEAEAIGAGADPFGVVTIDRSKRVLDGPAAVVSGNRVSGAPTRGVLATEGARLLVLRRLDFSDRIRRRRSISDRL